MAIDTIVSTITIKLLFKKKKVKGVITVINIIQIITFIICFIIMFSILQSERWNFLQLPVWTLFAIGGIYLAVYYFFNKNRVKERKENKVSLFGMLKEEIEKDTDIEFSKEMQKMYEKKNKKLSKKAKPELSWMEFVNLQEKEVQKSYKYKHLYAWGPIIIAIGYGVTLYVDTGFGIDLFIGVAIMFVVEAVILKGVWKIVKSGLEVKKAWIEAEKKKFAKNGEEMNEM